MQQRKKSNRERIVDTVMWTLWKEHTLKAVSTLLCPLFEHVQAYSPLNFQHEYTTMAKFFLSSYETTTVGAYLGQNQN